MVVLGIDPGLERIGYGVVCKDGSTLRAVEFGIIKTPTILLPDRLLLAREALGELIGRLKPDALATERLFFTRNQTTAMDVAKSLGVTLLVGAEHGLPWCEYSPPQVKRSVVGNGAADKRQVQYMVARLLNLDEPPRPDDVADALAVAITHCMHIGPVGFPPNRPLGHPSSTR